MGRENSLRKGSISIQLTFLLTSLDSTKQVNLLLIKHKPWSSLVEGGEGLYLPNCQTNLVFALHAPSLLFWHFVNTTAYHLGRYKPSSPVSCHAPR